MEENQKKEEKKTGKSSLAIFIILLLIVIVAGTVYIIITGESKDNEEKTKTNNTTKISQNATKNNNLQQNSNEEFENQVNSMEMAAFNAQFTSYSGMGLSSNQIKSLISSIRSSNKTDKKHLVKVKTEGDRFTSGILFPEGTNKDEDLEKITTEIKAGEQFSVEFSYDENGFINIVTIE